MGRLMGGLKGAGRGMDAAWMEDRWECMCWGVANSFTGCTILSTPVQGVDFVGLMFYAKSHRNIADPLKAKHMADLIRQCSKPGDSVWGHLPQSVGVFVREPAEKINELAAGKVGCMALFQRFSFSSLEHWSIVPQR